MICPLCGTNHDVVAAPFMDDPNKWVIYRKSNEEIIVYIKENMIVESKKLTDQERKYIIKHALHE